MPTNNASTLQDRKDAIREYITDSPDRAAAIAFIADRLDPEADVELVTWLTETFPQE